MAVRRALRLNEIDEIDEINPYRTAICGKGTGRRER
jgi:hypothetical protein